MNPTEYLEKSGRTTAPTAPEDMNLKLGDLLSLTDVIETGIESDRRKRLVFYKTTVEKADARAESAFQLLNNTVDEKLTPETVFEVDQKVMDLYHATLGIASEVGELAEALLYSLLNGKSLDDVNVREEIGDKLWYIALALRACEGTFPDSFARNIAKLAERYPDKFTTELAENRNLDAERAVLEESCINSTIDG